jgi:hypothetical protein
MKHPTHFSLSEEARTLLGAFAEARGLTRTGMLELLIRAFAYEEWDGGIPPAPMIDNPRGKHPQRRPTLMEQHQGSQKEAPHA